MTANAIKSHPIIDGRAEKSMVIFLPYLFTINDEIIDPPEAPMLNNEATQEASFEVNFTGESSWANSGNDGEAHPKNRPTDIIPKFPKKIYINIFNIFSSNLVIPKYVLNLENILFH